MAGYQTVLFDFDGTLVDSAADVFDALEKTLKAYDVVVQNPNFRRHIGPPMRETLAEYLPKEIVPQALDTFRSVYGQGGSQQCRLYGGVESLLKTLRQKGFVICLATSKPKLFAEKILAQFNLSQYFDYIGGASMDAGLESKEDVIRDVLAQPGIVQGNAVMIGDRLYDLEGAAACGLPCIAVLYGYGDAPEFEAYTPCYIAQSTQDLCEHLLANFEQNGDFS